MIYLYHICTTDAIASLRSSEMDDVIVFLAVSTGRDRALIQTEFKRLKYQAFTSS